MNEYILDELGYNFIGHGKNRIKPIKYKINGECWECTSHAVQGYPKITRNGKQYVLHRYVYEIYNNVKIPKGMNKVILHLCDNPLCIRPEHLKLGTQKDNIQDCVNKGRDNTKMLKELNKKLSNEQLLEIKKMFLNKIKGKVISDKIGIAPSVISLIKNGKSCYSEFLGGGLNDWLAQETVQEKEE